MEGEPKTTSKLEKVNQVIRIVLGVTALIVFTVGMIAFCIKYSRY